MSKHFRLTWGGYYDIETETEEEAIREFIDYFENEEPDDYGRLWKELIEIEELKE